MGNELAFEQVVIAILHLKGDVELATAALVFPVVAAMRAAVGVF